MERQKVIDADHESIPLCRFVDEDVESPSPGNSESSAVVESSGGGLIESISIDLLKQHEASIRASEKMTSTLTASTIAVVTAFLIFTWTIRSIIPPEVTTWHRQHRVQAPQHREQMNLRSSSSLLPLPAAHNMSSFASDITNETAKNATAGKNVLASSKKSKLVKDSVSVVASSVSAIATSKEEVKDSSLSFQKKVESSEDDKGKAVTGTKKAKATSSATRKKTATTSKRKPTNILTPSSSSPSKIISPRSGSSKPKKSLGTQGRQSVSTAATEEKLNLSSNNSTLIRATSSAAATGVLQGLNPSNDVVMAGTGSG